MSFKARRYCLCGGGVLDGTVEFSKAGLDGRGVWELE